MATDRDPVLSVLITVKNAASSVDQLIATLFSQAVPVSWEVVVSVAPSDDGTWEMLQQLENQHANLRVVPAESAGIPAGRNACVRASTGEMLITCDADDSPSTTWVSDMHYALQSDPLVAGRIILSIPGVAPTEPSQTPPTTNPLHPYGYLPYALTANMGFHREAWERVGGFDEAMRWGDDVDFSWRVQEAGIPLTQSEATVHKNGRSTPGRRFGQHFRYGLTDALLYKRHRARGMRRNWSGAIKAWGWLALTTPRLVSSAHRFTWMGVMGHRLGRLAGSAQQRTVYP